MPDEILRQSIIDEEHLKLLSLGYTVSGGVAALWSLFALLYVFMGLAFALAIFHTHETAGKAGEQPPAFFGWLIAGFGLAFFLSGIALAVARFWTAVSIGRRRSRTFCMVVAGISCLEFPYGTLLGVLSFIVLGRDSVKRLFTSTPPGAGGATVPGHSA